MWKSSYSYWGGGAGCIGMKGGGVRCGSPPTVIGGAGCIGMKGGSVLLQNVLTWRGGQMWKSSYYWGGGVSGCIGMKGGGSDWKSSYSYWWGGGLDVLTWRGGGVRCGSPTVIGPRPDGTVSVRI